MKTFGVEVVTPDATALATEATSLQVPAWEGYLGVLAGHAPLLAVLRAGVVTVKREDKADYYAVRGGFLEVGQNRVIILADDFVDAAKLDRTGLDKALAEAKKPVAETGGQTAEEKARLRHDAVEQRDLAIAWAEARLRALDWREGGGPG